MIGTVSTGRCHMPPARDRSGTLNYFFENFEMSDRPKSDHIVFVFRNIFCREMESDFKGPIVSIIIILVFFQVQEG